MERRSGFVGEVDELKPWEKRLVEQVNNFPESKPEINPENWLECCICRRKSEEVIPRSIGGIRSKRLSGLVQPQMDLCCDCTVNIRLGRIDIIKCFGPTFEPTGEEITVRNMDRAQNANDEAPNRLLISSRAAAVPVDSEDPVYMLKRLLGKR